MREIKKTADKMKGNNYPSRACGLAPTACFGVVPSNGLKKEKHKTNTKH